MAEKFNRRAISDPAQIRLLSSPVRQEIVDTLSAFGGEASVAALAEQLGRPADGLYYHLRALVRGALVLEVTGWEATSDATASSARAMRRYALPTTPGQAET